MMIVKLQLKGKERLCLFITSFKQNIINSAYIFVLLCLMVIPILAIETYIIAMFPLAYTEFMTEGFRVLLACECYKY